MASRLFEQMLRKLRGAYNHCIENGIAAPALVERYLLTLAKLLIRLKRPMVIGITGSVGKTTTASMIAQLLGSVECQPFVGRVICTVDNMNNHDGLALTVLGIPRWQRSTGQRLMLYVRAPLQMLVQLVSRRFPKVLVLEYGTDRSGYLGPMVHAVPPNIAVITTIGHAHLAGMGDLRGVLEEKSTLLTASHSPELVLLGSEHPFVDELTRRTTSRTILVSGAGAVSAQKFAQEIARFLGVPEDVIRSARTELSLERRFQLTNMGSYSVIDDSFNANPTSVTYALEQLAAIQWPGGRKIAVLGSMAELGSLSMTLHEQIGALAKQKVQKLISVGEAALQFHADAHFDNSTACAASIHTLIEAGDLILVKGSASAKMDLVVQRLLTEDLTAVLWKDLA